TRTASLSNTTGSINAIGFNEFEGTTVGGNFCGTHNAYTLYFAGKFDHAAKSFSAKNGKASYVFDPGTVLLKIGISYVSIANARMNLTVEDPGPDFDAAR